MFHFVNFSTIAQLNQVRIYKQNHNKKHLGILDLVKFKVFSKASRTWPMNFQEIH